MDEKGWDEVISTWIRLVLGGWWLMVLPDRLTITTEVCLYVCALAVAVAVVGTSKSRWDELCASLTRKNSKHLYTNATK